MDPKIAEMVQLLHNMIEDNLNYDENIPLAQISADTLHLLIKFCELSGFKNQGFVKKPVLASNTKAVFPNHWEREFFENLSSEQLFDLLNVRLLLPKACVGG